MFRFSCGSVTDCLDSLQAAGHEAGEHRHHHLRFDLHQVLGQRVHAGADLPGHGDGVPVEVKPHVS